MTVIVHFSLVRPLDPQIVLTQNGLKYNCLLKIIVAFYVSNYDVVWAEHRTQHISNAELMRYVLCHRRS